MRRTFCNSARLIVYISLIHPLFAGPAQTLEKSDSSGSSILEPASGALLGQFYGAGTIAQAAAKLGRTLPIHLMYYRWDDDWTGAVTKLDLAAGRIPLISWEPHHIDFAKIVDGASMRRFWRVRTALKHSARSCSSTLPPK